MNGRKRQESLFNDFYKLQGKLIARSIHLELNEMAKKSDLHLRVKSNFSKFSFYFLAPFSPPKTKAIDSKNLKQIFSSNCRFIVGKSIAIKGYCLFRMNEKSRMKKNCWKFSSTSSSILRLTKLIEIGQVDDVEKL